MIMYLFRIFHKFIKFFPKKFNVCKITTSKTCSYRKIPTFFLIENFLWMQINFFENTFLPIIFQKMFYSTVFYCCKTIFSKIGPYQIFNKICWSKIFYCYKIISSKIWSYQKFSTKCFVWKFFIVAKSFPRKHVPTKKFQQHFVVEYFFMVVKTFPRRQVSTRNFWLPIIEKKIVFTWRHIRKSYLLWTIRPLQGSLASRAYCMARHEG